MHTHSSFAPTLALLKRQKWRAVVVFVAAFSAVIGLVTSLPDLYRATATVLVDQEDVAETFVKRSVIGELEPRLRSVSQRILSRSSLQDLVVRFDLYREMRKRASPEAVVERMRNDIELQLKGVDQKQGNRTTIAFNLSYQGWDPDTAARVTNTLASLYVKENESVRGRMANQTTEFLKDKLKDAEKKLHAQEQRITRFKKSHLGELGEQREANLATLTELNSQLRTNSENQFRAMEERERFLGGLSGIGRSGPGEGAEGPVARLIRLKRTLEELRARYTDSYPDIVHVKREIATLERQQRRSGASGGAYASPAIERSLRKIDQRLESLRKEEERIRLTITRYQRRVENAPTREQTLQTLRRDYEAAREAYASLLQRYEDAQIAEALVQQKGGQFRLLNPAVPPAAAVGPNRSRLALIGLVLSVGMAVGLVFLAEQFDTSFHSLDDLRAFTKVPVLASIPRIITRGDIWRSRLRFCFGTLSIVLLAVLLAQALQYVGNDNQKLVWVLVKRGM